MEKTNKLIAEFMGVDEVDIDCAIEEYGQLKYHTSWDWLMPVAEKCLTSDENTDGQHYFINDALLTCNIEVVYDRVVEFIKDYNQNNTEYKTCDKCSYDNLDDNGDVLEHYCEDDELNTPNN
tara:strand:- start:5232 stop:5597 length:366 start_codon:yes stop_codon:yes gene_type:complete